MKNIEFYKAELSKIHSFIGANRFARSHGMTIENDQGSWQAFNSWLNAEHPLLDDTEKRYLKNIIKPFREQVCWIKKKEVISISEEERIEIFVNGDDDICLPSFEKGEMYIGMKRDKLYTVEELGL